MSVLVLVLVVVFVKGAAVWMLLGALWVATRPPSTVRQDLPDRLYYARVAHVEFLKAAACPAHRRAKIACHECAGLAYTITTEVSHDSASV
jgi:hypothetical protein